jgi:hypothetical protein
MSTDSQSYLYKHMIHAPSAQIMNPDIQQKLDQYNKLHYNYERLKFNFDLVTDDVIRLKREKQLMLNLIRELEAKFKKATSRESNIVSTGINTYIVESIFQYDKEIQTIAPQTKDQEVDTVGVEYFNVNDDNLITISNK